MHLMPLGDTAKQLANLHFLGTHLQPPVTRGVHLVQAAHQYMSLGFAPFGKAAVSSWFLRAVGFISCWRFEHGIVLYRGISETKTQRLLHWGISCSP